MKYDSYNNCPAFTSNEIVKWFEDEGNAGEYRQRDDGSKSITLDESFYVDGAHYLCGSTIFCKEGSITIERSNR